ncbi:hypothetical protein OCAE111667_03305 [Occultella aeris]|uniref:Uncharacterized protein n=1 Tax=Occultella aeris TaxID=2761496 RepID=A0A7M4DDE3_9MICO|nr:hypothetical protein [Occultella aeris]VZO34862.1 hypothetical protein HALOF300_00132 [Occultella aeris]
MNSTDTFLNELAILDPAAASPPTDPEAIEGTRLWVLGHDRAAHVADAGAPALAGVSELVTRLQEEPVAPKVRRSHSVRLRVALIGAAAVLVLGVVGVLPSVLPGGGTTTPPAAALPMLAYSEPDGADGPTGLLQLADQVRASTIPDGSGRYFFEHRRYVGYATHEVEVSEGYWEADRLIPIEDDAYRWHDTTDLSGGQLYLRDGEDLGGGETVFAPGEAGSDPRDVPDSPQAIYELIMLNNDQHQRFPGHYLIDAYNFQANGLSQADRANFLEAIALAGDVTSYGRVTDREGRDGLAFGASRFEDAGGETIEIELILILDPATGAVLETDTVYPNDLPGAPDIVEQYDLVVDSRYTDTLPACGTVTCPGAADAG